MYKFSFSLFLVFISSLPLFAGQNGNGFSKKKISRQVNKAIEWQVNKPWVGQSRWNENKRYDWVEGTFYAGLAEYYKYAKIPAHLDELQKVAASCNWEPRGRPYDANEYVMIQAYSDLYEVTNDYKYIDKSVFMANMPLIKYLDIDMRFDGNPYWQTNWTWCDALFMAPPTYARLGKVLDKKEYFDFMDKNWWATSDYLYSPQDSLYYRDDTFFPEKQRSESGHKVFWSRGNGWVMGGLCRVLDYLPEDYPSRKKYEQQFIEMAHRLLTLQTEEGFWPTSLLDYDQFNSKESSGTAFYCYAYAWGINQGLLDKETFLPAVRKSWTMLENCLHKNGKFGYVQQIGDQPGNAQFEDEQSYGVGAFVLAGTELMRMIDTGNDSL